MKTKNAALTTMTKSRTGQSRTRIVSADKGLRSRAPPRTRAQPTFAATPAGELIEPIPRIGRLQTVADWHRQVAKIYRAMRKGRMVKEDGTKLIWAADIGAKLAKAMEESRELALLRQKLEELGALPAGMAATALPAIEATPEDDDPQEPI